MPRHPRRSPDAPESKSTTHKHKEKPSSPRKRSRSSASLRQAEHFDDIDKAIAQGLTGRRRLRHLAEKWHITDRNVRVWLRRYWDDVRSQAAPTPEERRQELVGVVEGAIGMAAEKGRPRDMISGAKLLSELHGLSVQRHEHSGPGGKPIELGVNLREEAAKGLDGLSDEEIAQYRALLRKMRGAEPG